MMAITWTEDLRTGVDEIDNQHKDLFFRLNELMEACERKKGKEEIGSFLDFLADYVILHFATEEREMLKHNYPAMADHMREHSQFKVTISDLRNSYNEKGASIDVVLIAVRTSYDWLQNHIRKTDKLLGAFLKAKLQA